MRDAVLFFAAATLLNVVSLINMRLPDSGTNILVILPTFAAVVIGVPMWLYATAQYSIAGGIVAGLVPYLLVRRAERMLPPRQRIVFGYLVLVLGLVCAHFAVRAPTWL